MKYIISDLRKNHEENYTKIEFKFEGYDAVLLLPDKPCKGNKWLLKTEYFDAFPHFQMEMVKRGYALGFVANETRWYKPTDADRKARFCEYLVSEYGLNSRTVLVGMSCGGMHAVYFTAKYPEKVSGLYLDAPVMNLLSCPCGVGDAGDSMYDEFTKATGFTVSEMINYRNHPIDKSQILIEHKVPVFLVCGDSDDIVPFHENGKMLLEKYSDAGLPIEFILKKDCGHHPHGLEDNAPLIDFVLKLK